jgi:hypothetical protein
MSAARTGQARKARFVIRSTHNLTELFLCEGRGWVRKLEHAKRFTEKRGHAKAMKLEAELLEIMEDGKLEIYVPF